MAKNPVVKGKEEPEKPFVCGTYAGTWDRAFGSATQYQTIVLGFRPSVVAVQILRQTTHDQGEAAIALDGKPVTGATSSSSNINIIEITESGFKAGAASTQNGEHFGLNFNGYTYVYIAFR